MALLKQKVGLTELNVPVDDAGGVASLLLPSSQDALLDMYIEHGEHGENGEHLFDGLTPYYGIIWPSAYALCRHVGRSEIPAGSKVLELGCGVGLAGIAAAVTGAPASVVLTDLDPIAVELAQMNAERSGVGSTCSTAILDWYDLEAWPEAGYDVVLGADILYEPEACDAVAALLARTLRPGGAFLLADGKGRRNRTLLWEALLGGGAFELVGDERWMTVADPRPDDPEEMWTGAVAQMEERGPARTQPVVLARFRRTDGGAVRAVGLC